MSVLAGAYLAIELGRRLVLGKAACDFNYWWISPWASPVTALKDMRGRYKGREFRSQTVLLRTARALWGSSL